MFESLDVAAPDAILGLNEAFKKDPNPEKINLSVGVYKAADGATPVLETVKEAEKRLLAAEATKSYLGIDGAPEFAGAVTPLVLGPGAEAAVRAAVVQTPGGTGALRVAADFLKQQLGAPTVWLSDPTWANHAAIFDAAGVPTDTYPYYDASSQALAFDAMCEALRAVPPGDVVLLHGCCHNPTGMDPTPEQWQVLAGIAREAGWLPLVDFAYQGFGDGLEQDAAGVRTIAASGVESLICASYSKNFGLYRERVGALLVIAKDSDGAARVLGHLKRAVRRNYSNPPAHGGLVVAAIMQDDDLRAAWEKEVSAMRDRINGMRRLFVETLAARGVTQDFSFLTRQRGMFSFSGLTKDEVEALRTEFAIYIVGSGRINVAGMTEANMDRLCGCIAEVLARRG